MALSKVNHVLACMIAVASCVAAPVAAQSRADILETLDRQEEILRSAPGTRSTGPNRGLVIAPQSGGQAAQPAAPQASASSARPARQQAATRVVPQDLPQLPDGTRLDIAILFEYDSAVVSPASISQVDLLCDVIQQGDASRNFYIIGHTDASGSASYNRNLSELRAQEVRRLLVTDCDVAEDRLIAVGMGEERLLPSLAPGAAAQRRVEVMLWFGS